VSEEITADDDALSAQVLNGTIEVDGVPVDGRGRDEAQAGRTEALVLEGAVSDLALTMKEDRATQRVAGLALVESGMAALPQVGIRQPLQGEEGAFDPSKRPQCARRTAAAGRSTLVVRRWASIAWTIGSPRSVADAAFVPTCRQARQSASPKFRRRRCCCNSTACSLRV